MTEEDKQICYNAGRTFITKQEAQEYLSNYKAHQIEMSILESMLNKSYTKNK